MINEPNYTSDINNNELLVHNKNLSNSKNSCASMLTKGCNSTLKSIAISFSIFSIPICICSILLFSCVYFLNSLESSGISMSSGSSNYLENRIYEEEIKKISFNTASTGNVKKVAVVDITGSINYTPDPLTPTTDVTSTNNQIINAQLDKAMKDVDVEFVILNLNTPGGAVAAAQPICSKIKEVNNKKPVYAFVDTEAASLGYLIANCTKKIYARPFSIVGSIGVRLDAISYKRALNNIGIDIITITNSKGAKKTYSNISDPNSEEYREIQSMLDEIYEYFINIVWGGRSMQSNNKLTKEKLLNLADGRILSADQAYKNGMVDKVTDFDSMLTELANEKNLDNISLIKYRLNTSIFDSLLFGIFNIRKMLNHGGEIIQINMY